MQDFVNLFKTEFLKTKKTLIFWSTILLPFIICGFVFIGFYFKSGRFINYPPEMQWIYYIGSINAIMGILLLPMFTIFLAYSINNVEHEADSWKSLFSLPISRWSIYSSKYTYILSLNALCLLFFPVFILLYGNLLVIFEPRLRLDEYSAVLLVIKIYFKLFLSSIGILAIQFFLSILWRNFMKSTGLGLAGTIIGLISVQAKWEYAWLIPYSHPSITLNSLDLDPSHFHILTLEVFCSLIFGLIFFIIGYLTILRKVV